MVLPIASLLGVKGLAKPATKLIIAGVGFVIIAKILTGKGKSVGESFESAFTGIGGGIGSGIGNIGEGFGRFGTGFGEGFTAIISAFGGPARGIFNYFKSFTEFSRAHQQLGQTTFNFRTIQFAREGFAP